ncbi:MAG: diadenylate cyclase CdaA [Myxococcota bacterium]|jgi:uncharacterized protein (TIGR00159 family)|nr:diadenylate cyclase CdaA [Myxococcota bacterium]
MNGFWDSVWGENTAPFWVILDLVIVYYLVYLTLLLIRGTRTVSMALGLLVIIIVYIGSRTFGLATTYMLLDQFMEVAVIFALIIFQDDIRRALVRMGRFASFTKAQESQVLEEVTKAAQALAAKRIGAIFVFEREASLEEFIDGGTVLDAAVSRELLYTIFIPRLENPLHDGAVMLRNFRLNKAGCLLPLSMNQRIDKNFGTRHRAALGITEQTDAVSVVVSEERGSIALCFGGRISKNLDAAALRKALAGLFSKEKARERRKAAEERKSRGMARSGDRARDNTRPSTLPPPLEGLSNLDPDEPPTREYSLKTRTEKLP